MYFLFVGDDFYPARAMDDYTGTFDTMELALAHARTYHEGSWYQIATIRDGQLTVVAEGRIEE